MAAKKAAAKKPAAKKTARKPNAAFMKAMTPSAALAKIVGEKPLPRTEVVKKLWAYVKKNNLQDKKEKRNINADEPLREVFGGKKTVSMFEMTKLVNDNLK
jgi:upstream activation factor subunit UAF30